MAQVKTTGYVRVQSGQQTQLDLRNYGQLISARIRWKGVSSVQTGSSTNTKSGDGFISTPVPPVPSGWSFNAVEIITTVKNVSGQTAPTLNAISYLGADSQSNSAENIPNNGVVTAKLISVNPDYLDLHAHHSGSITGVSGGISVTGIVTTSYRRTVDTLNPRGIVNGSLVQYVGSLNDGSVTPWYSLAGLVAGQINTIAHSVSNSGVVDCEIEYTVIASPVVKTNVPTDISYSTASLNGEVIVTNGEDPVRYFEYGTTPGYGTVLNKGVGGVGAYSHDLTGLEFDTTYYYRAYAINSEGTGYGEQKSFRTLYPYLAAPARHSPDEGLRTMTRRPWIELTLAANADNPATKYHARIRFSAYVDMTGAITCDSSENPECWELWDGGVWVPFPAEGVDPGSKVRGRVPADLSLGTLYWDAAVYDGVRYSPDTTSRSIRILLTVNGLYALAINNVDYQAYSIEVKETCNGQVGEIILSINNIGGQAIAAVKDGDSVVLAVNDSYGNSEEFRGLVRGRTPQSYALTVRAITGSGIMADRLIKEDYPEQDIGLTAKDIIDTYCVPLTSSNINTSTGIVAPVKAKDKTPLSVYEDLRRKFGVFYFIDKDWDTHLYLPAAITQAYTTVGAGEMDG
jgi:hypothetical protein